MGTLLIAPPVVAFFPHRAAAALRAISLRRLALRFSARAWPPRLAPMSAICLRRSGESFCARSLANSTAAAFF